MMAVGHRGDSWQHHKPLVLEMIRKLRAVSVSLHHFARTRVSSSIARPSARCASSDSMAHGPSNRSKGMGRPAEGNPSDLGDTLCQIKNYQIVAPVTWNVGSRSVEGSLGLMEEAPTATNRRGRSCLPFVRSCSVYTVDAHDAPVSSSRFRTT
jgi:uptake hydrogenase large subunit